MPLFIFPREAPYPRSALGWDGDDFRVLSIDADGQLQVDVVTSGLPAGAATAANQALILARLPGTHFNVTVPYIEHSEELNAAAGTDELLNPGPPVGFVNVINTLYAWNGTTNITHIRIGVRIGAQYYWVAHIAPTVVHDPCVWSGQLIVPNGVTLRAYFSGTVAGDNIFFDATGHVMELV